MITNAIICELNPIHLGHKHVFDVAKDSAAEESVNIAVMSGNFTQRATPAIYDKYTRAEAAVGCGADIVIELPFPWCSSGVESFALGGVAVAAGLLANRLVFGSETGEYAILEKVSKIKASEEFLTAAKEAEALARDKGSAVIFDEVMKSFGIISPLGANDKLGLEYIRFGKELGIGEFHPTRRVANLKSATELRQMIFSGNTASCDKFIPKSALELFAGKSYCSEDKFNELLFNHCRLYTTKGENDILSYASKIAKEQKCAGDFIKKLPTKKYTLARLRREILFSILGASAEKTPPLYTVLLAANAKGRSYLSEKRKNISVPIITKPSETDGLSAAALAQYALTQKADELYALLTEQPASQYIKKHPHIS